MLEFNLANRKCCLLLLSNGFAEVKRPNDKKNVPLNNNDKESDTQKYGNRTGANVWRKKNEDKRCHLWSTIDNAKRRSRWIGHELLKNCMHRAQLTSDNLAKYRWKWQIAAIYLTLFKIRFSILNDSNECLERSAWLYSLMLCLLLPSFVLMLSLMRKKAHSIHNPTR